MQPIVTNVPGFGQIPLVAYYKEFLGYYRDCELETKAWFVRNMAADWVTFDCGANIGYYSILFSCLSPRGCVYAFEPTDTVEMLRANLAYSNAVNVEIVNVALGAVEGVRKEKVFKIWGTQPALKDYPFTTIDNYVASKHIERLDCVKIDTDSYDLEVLQGAAKTLTTLNPFVMVELNYALKERNQTVTQALTWLLEVGYTTCMVYEGENFLLKHGFHCGGQRAIADVLKEKVGE